MFTNNLFLFCLWGIYMFIKLFLLGRPGCGKSSAAKHMTALLQSKGWSTRRFMDFSILQAMSQEEKHKNKFKNVQKDRFDVVESVVLDEALERLHLQLVEYMGMAQQNEVLFIEFARSNYEEALTHFSTDVLQNAYFLFIDVDLNICIRRVERRMKNPESLDDHYVSEEMLIQYYTDQKIPSNWVEQGKCSIVNNNNDSLEDFNQKIDNVVKDIFK